MDSGTLGLIGGIVGSLLGTVGGLIGTYASISNTKGPRERAFAVKASVAVWILVVVFVLGLLLIARPYNLLLWIPYAIALIVGVPAWNKTQSRIRTEESDGAN